MEAIKKYMSDAHLEAILDECKERNLTFDEYLVMYLLSKCGHEFWDHVDNLIKSKKAARNSNASCSFFLSISLH